MKGTAQAIYVRVEVNETRKSTPHYQGAVHAKVPGRGRGRAASGGAPEPPRATRITPECIRNLSINTLFFNFFLFFLHFIPG